MVYDTAAGRRPGLDGCCRWGRIIPGAPGRNVAGGGLSTGSRIVGARAQNVLRPGLVGVRDIVLRVLPQPRACLGIAERSCGPIWGQGFAAAGPPGGSVAEISAGGAAIHRALF